jgi:MinD superfamily P-loop ATPase
MKIMAKQIVIVSGKGGTGKTVISAAFCAIAKNKVIVDADVDAADLFLLLNPTNKETHKFSGGYKAIIDQNACTQCGLCYDSCRFKAIHKNFTVNDVLCEGCGLCAKICPNNAISMQPSESGEWYISQTNHGTFVHAKLGIAEENSGKLIDLIKQKAIAIADKNNCEWIIVDGPPGIGCPAIAALGSSDCAIIVTEPTISGLHDAKRVVELTKHFGLPTKFIINKYDLNQKITEEIENFCNTNQIDIIGKLIFDESIVQSIINGQTLMEHKEFAHKDVLLNAWDKIKKTIN